MRYTEITEADAAANPDLYDWRPLFDSLQTEFRCGSFAAAAAFVATIADAADALEHHPDVDLRYPDRVLVRLTTHFTHGLTTHDVNTAIAISGLAKQAGAIVDHSAGQVVEIGIDTLDASRIRPFWAAVLDYREVDGALVDRRRVGPRFWFQEMTEPRTERSRFHIDISVPHDVAETRIAAALAAGGRLVGVEFARAWWVLADADGNEACICTWQDR